MADVPKFFDWSQFLRELFGTLDHMDEVVQVTLPRHPRLAPIAAACLCDVYGDDAAELGRLLQSEPDSN